MRLKQDIVMSINQRSYDVIKEVCVDELSKIMLVRGKHTTNETDVLNYEVWKLKAIPILGILKERPNFKEFTHYWKKPSNTDFGSSGWCYQHKKDAISKFNEVLDDF